MKRGFSLVELSIVLVILGLLVGGILAGQSLIRAAELRSIGTEQQRFTTAIHAFRDKYFAVPGDFSRATNLWGTAANCPGTQTQPSTNALTCDGDADGIIGVSATSNEAFRHWQHLANAGLIEGNYTGVRADTNDWSASARNVPNSRMPGLLWFTWNNSGGFSGNAAWFDYDYGNRYDIGTTPSNGQPAGRPLKPEEVWNIDAKIDDGKPGRGKMMVVYWDECTDAASSASRDANYLLSETTPQCFITFPRMF